MAESQIASDVDLDWGSTAEAGRQGQQGQPVPLVVRSLTPAEWAGVRAAHADTTLRLWMCGVLGLIFIGLNMGVGVMVYAAYLSDLDLLTRQLVTADQRVISEKAFLALIGATVVQVGAGIATIVAYLFPRRSGS